MGQGFSAMALVCGFSIVVRLQRMDVVSENFYLKPHNASAENILFFISDRRTGVRRAMYQQGFAANISCKEKNFTKNHSLLVFLDYGVKLWASADAGSFS